MEGNGRYRPDPAADPAPVRLPPPRTGARILALLGLFMLLPVAAVAVVFPALSGQPFASADDIAPADIRWLYVRLLNRAELDGGDDVGPYYADPADYPALLAPLKGVPEVAAFSNARGPWLGEYRVMTAEGRRGTIRLYWVRDPQAPPDAPAKLRFQLGRHLYEGGTAAAVIAAAEAVKPRGRPNR